MYIAGVKNGTWPKAILVIIALFLLVLNIVRIIRVPITFDEAWTYFDYVSDTWANIIINPTTANNHILNSLCAKCLVFLFKNDSLFVLRLPNLLAHIGYMYFGYRILKKLLRNEWQVLAGFIMVNLNPFLFDFWGLCRGYGLSIGLMMASVYFFLKYADTDRISSLCVSMLLMVLATYSNFAALNVFIAMAVVALAKPFFFTNRYRVQLAATIAIVIIICSALLYLMIGSHIMVLKQKGEFYYGSKFGFIEGTVYSLVKEFFFSEANNPFLIKISYVCAVVTAFVGGYWIINTKQVRKNKSFLYGILLWLLLVIPIISTILQHKLFDTLFLIERTALFFYTLFILQLLAFLGAIQKYRFISSVFILVIVSACLLSFGRNMNISYARTWEYDRYTELVVKRITKDKTRLDPAKVDVYWMLMPSFSYYCKTYPLTVYSDYLGVEREKMFSMKSWPDTAYDYYYAHPGEYPHVPKTYIEDTSFFDRRYILFRKNILKTK